MWVLQTGTKFWLLENDLNIMESQSLWNIEVKLFINLQTREETKEWREKENKRRELN